MPVEGIVVDGDLSDWPGEMDRYQISVHDEDSLRERESDLRGEFRAGYNREENAMCFGRGNHSRSRDSRMHGSRVSSITMNSETASTYFYVPRRDNVTTLLDHSDP